MIKKDIVISWFKGLSADDRIDLICNILDCCLPWEIRFFNTFMEAQVQRDYLAFRQAESTANNPTDLSCLVCLDDSHIRRKLCVCLALLHSSNRQAAAVMFGILDDYQPSTFVEEEFFTELSLLMTMSAHHPAFSFHHKHVLHAKLKQLKQAANRTSDLSETVSESSSGSSTFSFDQDVTTKFERHDDFEDGTVFQDCKTEREDLPLRDLPAVAKDQTPEVYVKELKLHAIEKAKEKERKTRHDLRKRDDHWYVLQVLWGDDTTDTIHRTYEEMFDFQCKLRKMYPNKVDANGNPWKLPFLPGRIRIFNKPEQKGEKTPIPDITDYIRLFSSLPKFVRGCDHVVKFFQCEKGKRKRLESKKAKHSSKKEQVLDKMKQKEFDTPHRIAEVVREQSLGESERDGKKSENKTDATNQSQNRDQIQADEGSPAVIQVDENGNELKVTASDAMLPSVEAVLSSSASVVNNTTPKLSTNSLHSSVEKSLVSLHVALPSTAPVTSYPSPSVSPSGSPVTSPTVTPSFPRQSCAEHINWAFRPHGRALTVSEWLRRLRLHKYSDVFRGKTFDEMLKLTDEDFGRLGLTAGARRKLRVNLEVLRTSGCFTSSGLILFDIIPSPSTDPTPLKSLCSAHSKGILISENHGHSPVCYSSAADSCGEFLYSESDSASDCGSDLLSEPRIQTGFSRMYKKTFPVLNSCRVSCYNCGSLGHVGGQCMAPNLDKIASYGYHFKCDKQLEC
ncbi:uncharacterized protein [Porites lutea]|uniref:uncharacterized protein n=1 Tax=Porites lutea TaxID=51062 RepID=UPI003CC5C608